MPIHLEDFADVVFHCICKFLPVKQVVQLRRTCHRFEEVAKDSLRVLQSYDYDREISDSLKVSPSFDYGGERPSYARDSTVAQQGVAKYCECLRKGSFDDTDIDEVGEILRKNRKLSSISLYGSDSLSNAMEIVAENCNGEVLESVTFSDMGCIEVLKTRDSPMCQKFVQKCPNIKHFKLEFFVAYDRGDLPGLQFLLENLPLESIDLCAFVPDASRYINGNLKPLEGLRSLHVCDISAETELYHLLRIAPNVTEFYCERIFEINDENAKLLLRLPVGLAFVTLWFDRTITDEGFKFLYTHLCNAYLDRVESFDFSDCSNITYAIVDVLNEAKMKSRPHFYLWTYKDRKVNLSCDQFKALKGNFLLRAYEDVFNCTWK